MLHCPTRSELAARLSRIIQDVYRLRADSEAAKTRSEQQTALLNVLQKTRADQRVAQRALADHIKEHGCEN
jgi:hypothetical protein